MGALAIQSKDDDDFGEFASTPVGTNQPASQPTSFFFFEAQKPNAQTVPTRQQPTASQHRNRKTTSETSSTTLKSRPHHPPRSHSPSHGRFIAPKYYNFPRHQWKSYLDRKPRRKPKGKPQRKNG